MKQKQNYYSLLLFAFIFLFSTSTVFSQVTIGSDLEPQVTLDIQPDATGSTPAGLLIPRLTTAQLAAKTYGAEQNSAMVYVTDDNPKEAKKQAAEVLRHGFYYFDSAKKLWQSVETPLRPDTVYVGYAQGNNYQLLQNAYDSIAKKKYNQSGRDNPVTFICSGYVGGLMTDGSIPKIRVVGKTDASFRRFEFRNTDVLLQGVIGSVEFDLTAYNSIVFLETADYSTDPATPISATINCYNLIMDRSSLLILNSGEKSGKTTINARAVYSKAGNIELGDANININFDVKPDSGEEPPYFAFLASHGGVLATKGGIIEITGSNAGAPLSRALFSASDGGVMELTGNVYFNHTSTFAYDFYAIEEGKILLKGFSNHGSGENPSGFSETFMAADILSGISVACMTASGNQMMRQVKGNAFSVATGSTISFFVKEGAACNYVLSPSTETMFTGTGIYAQGGDFIVNGKTGKLTPNGDGNPMSDNQYIDVRGFQWGLYVIQGGKIFTNGNISYGGYSLTLEHGNSKIDDAALGSAIYLPTP